MNRIVPELAPLHGEEAADRLHAQPATARTIAAASAAIQGNTAARRGRVSAATITASLSNTSPSWIATSRADCHRRSGSLRKHVRTIFSSDGEAGSGGGSLPRIADASAAG